MNSSAKLIIIFQKTFYFPKFYCIFAISMRKKFIKTLWVLIVVFILSIVCTFTAIWNGWIGYMPDVEKLQNPIDRYATQVYSSDGQVLGTWNMSRDNRIRVEYKDISPYLVQALVATEDERFFEHSGVDFIALSRALVKRGLLGQASAGGGSTITQQLAKQLYSKKAQSTFERILQKPIEWCIAVKLERLYTKEEIITMYLNYFDFLHNAVGIKNASYTYFGKESKNLDIEEAAMLVGLCKNPSYFNPVRHPERCQERRNVVLSQMQKAGYISEADYKLHACNPIKLDFHKVDHKEGNATYLREFLRKYMTAHQPSRSDYPSWDHVQYTIDSIAWAQDPLYGWCNKNFKADGTPYDIYEDGLRIYTTIDSRMQKYAEESVYAHVAKYLQPVFTREMRARKNAPFSNDIAEKDIRNILYRSKTQSERWRTMKIAGYSDEEINASFNVKTEMTIYTGRGEVDTIMTPMDSIRYYKSLLRSGFVSMDPKNGAVKAYVGGLDFAHFQYDMVSAGRRQVGSTMKPLLYSLAMENGFTPCQTVPNAPQTYMVAGRPWTPRNASHARQGQMVTLKWGLAQSSNWVSAHLMSQLDPVQFVELLHQYGIRNPEIHPSMALCLGPCDISVLEMVSAYTAFANKGIRCAPMFVTRIEDNNGNVIANFEPRMNEVISEESANKMLVLLQGVVDGGTAGRLRYKYNLTAQMGGKTGTTNNNSDAWFMGVTPNLISGCWVGGEDRDIHFSSMTMGQGATMALPVFAYFMKKVYADPRLPYSQNDKFALPDGYDACGQGESEQDDFSAIEDVYE